MKVFSFHLMPYADIDLKEAAKYPSVWVKFPNSNYDPVKGHKLYNRYLDELELADELGFDGVAVNEHHQNAYGLMPSPIVTAAALSRRVDKAKIAILGSGFGLRENPLTLAEEHAMIDNITGGRLISGFVRGIGAEYHSMGVNPVTSLERHMEAHDLVVRAWTEPGPFSYTGKHYQFDYVNLWPRPYQQPHPPIWCPSQGSIETLEWACHPSRRYVYAQAYSPFTAVARYLNAYRDIAQKKYGYEAASDRIAWNLPVYVADTDEQAMREAKPHLEAMFNTFLSMPTEFLFPPGYTSRDSLRRMMQTKGAVFGKSTGEGLVEKGIAVVGSPDTVRKRFEQCHRELGFQNLVTLLQFGTLPGDLTERNIRLFAKEVLPALQALSDKEYRGFDAKAVVPV
jgi:alkanesulfonate monooxygenase SsuD/methylene tetrahydromethanopterin reductase-like flavin-dependent oxidoreductase (luciferase family)